jgi:hypothetical protein
MSHFSFTRNLYDNCALEKKDQESKAPFQWVTDSTVIESDKSCYQRSTPYMHKPFSGIPKTSVDVESDLRGQTIKLSRCPQNKFNPEKQEKKDIQLTDCTDTDLLPEFTRLNKSCNMFSGISINRFHPLCEDVQELEKIQENSYIGMNTRLAMRDAHNK